jgi:hypothetical protein
VPPLEGLPGLSRPAKTSELAVRSTVSGSKPEVVASYGRLPLYFEPNLGQTDPQVRFLARTQGLSIFLEETAVSLVLGGQVPASVEAATVRLELQGARKPRTVSGVGRLPGISNYFLGNDPKKWRTGIPHYASVRFREVYPGVDLVYRANRGTLEYDFVVEPGADPGVIQVAVEGGDRLRVARNGDLVLLTRLGEVRWRRPVVYQQANKARRLVEASYVLKSARRAAFKLGHYDRGRPLVIDPVLLFSAYPGVQGKRLLWTVRAPLTLRETWMSPGPQVFPTTMPS